jgi:hypothetical protein
VAPLPGGRQAPVAAPVPMYRPHGQPNGTSLTTLSGRALRHLLMSLLR